ncbi:hypothetical protein GLOTRDRAFT_112038 [Gloeophyllum trabeum ATCC 11539]|uniref:MYND-type domain-containing protein n=1 Tax=Gloeophyllum trabeum (strain ATCC 11539 / FP-39264 / Madison 617) TaxID=670483 RepID=S7RJ44_GLOTA|nr:uncharacterized protein GLOTRDRAFT_112038 [Gloeophyllum trabeum ATCC 11539]EPQ52644.1 hypothetical protein GLOTRDRAFT_112038 [Gloeophyllum trabeum ATCC 11539]
MQSLAPRENNLGPQSNLRNHLRFRPYFSLPFPGYWREDEMRQHWCFIGEIVQDVSLVRLSVNVRDVEGNELLVAFHTNDRGESFRARCMRGSTFVLLYAKQYNFVFGEHGFRIEEEHLPFLKVFDIPLESLLRINDKLHAGAYADQCGLCGKQGVSARCSGCSTVLYCGKRCQVSAWKAAVPPGGHKEECKILRALVWFTQRDWSTFNGKFRFA